MQFLAYLLLVQIAQSQTFEIGEVDLFGQTGLDESAIRSALTIHAGDKIKLGSYFAEKSKLENSVKQALGKPPTDVGLVLSDEQGKAMVFVGLPGPTVKAVTYRPVMHDHVVLPGDGLRLYTSGLDRLMKVSATTALSEDDSRGYALFSDPGLKSIQLKMRSYALKSEEGVMAVLRLSPDPSQRQAAAMLLGYAGRSRRQLDGLADASLDSDETVRNNATRALIVISHADPSICGLLPNERFVDMLRSGIWTDRNKGGNLVEALTRSRNPKLLTLIRERALPSLIEMARWTNPPHASPARQILGRIAGIEERRLQELVTKGNVETILDALRVARPGPGEWPDRWEPWPRS